MVQKTLQILCSFNPLIYNLGAQTYITYASSLKSNTVVQDDCCTCILLLLLPVLLLSYTIKLWLIKEQSCHYMLLLVTQRYCILLIEAADSNKTEVSYFIFSKTSTFILCVGIHVYCTTPSLLMLTLTQYPENKT